jgi:hypothetical protein
MRFLVTYNGHPAERFCKTNRVLDEKLLGQFELK